MKRPKKVNGCANQRTASSSKQDLRAWCAKLECSEVEVRDTLRAILRLMASVSRKHVYH
jgi:hypothetical protein